MEGSIILLFFVVVKGRHLESATGCLETPCGDSIQIDGENGQALLTVSDNNTTTQNTSRDHWNNTDIIKSISSSLSGTTSKCLKNTTCIIEHAKSIRQWLVLLNQSLYGSGNDLDNSSCFDSGVDVYNSSGHDSGFSLLNISCVNHITQRNDSWLQGFTYGLGAGLVVTALTSACLGGAIIVLYRRSRLLTVVKSEPKNRKETNCKKRKRRGLEEVNMSIQMNNHTYAISPEDNGSSTGLAIADETRVKTLGEVNRKVRQVPARTPDGYDLAEINRESNGKVLIENPCLQGVELGRDLGNRHTHQTEENIYDQSNIRGIRILHSDETYSHVEIYTPV